MRTWSEEERAVAADQFYEQCDGDWALMDLEAGIEVFCQRNDLWAELHSLTEECRLYGGPKGCKMDLSQARAALERSKP